MTHPNTQPGSLPEDRFDQWLDALVAGTPADAASHNGTDGSLDRAMSGARLLHGLATRTTPAAAAQRRIEEDLMRSGALATPRSTTWIPIEMERRRAPWWSPTSPVIAAALVVALIVALGASFIATQRPAPTPSEAPGFAMASPDATGTIDTAWKDLFVVTDGADLSPTNDGPFAVAVLDEGGLTLPVGDGTVTLPDVTEIDYTGVPSRALIRHDDGSRAVIDLTTGDILFDVPPFRTGAQDEGDHRFIPTDDTLTDWEVVDLATGDTRLLSDIVELPGDTAVMPTRIDPRQVIGDAQIFRVEAGRMDGLRWIASDPDAATFVDPGSLDRAAAIPDYPTVRDGAGSPVAVMSDDGATFAYESRAGDDRIVLLDTATGQELARFDVDQVGDDPTLAGFDSDGRLIAGTGDRLVAIDWTAGGSVTTIAAGFERLANPLVYAPGDLAYAKQADALLRIDLATGDVIQVASGLVPGAFEFTVAGSPWITFYSQDGRVLLDARTGEIASRMKPPSVSQLALYGEAWAGGDGSALIFATEPPPMAKSAWLLSPEFPDGVKLTVPADDGNFIFNFSQTGQYMYAKDDGYSRVGSLWMTPITAEPEWRELTESVNIVASFAIPANDTRTLPAQDFATPMTSPASERCDLTPPNGNVPPGENAGLDWLGSSAEHPSLWLMMTWDDGTIETNQVSEDYPVKLTFWRGEGSGEIDVTATGPDGETLPADTFEPFQGDPIPGIHPFGGTVPEAGCWTLTATDGNDTLTWTVDVQAPEAMPEASPAASPVAASATDPVIVIEGTAAEARTENGVRIATLGGDGLTLPVGGEIITVPDAVQVRTIRGHSDTLHVIRDNGTEAVVDLANGDILFEIPEFQNWARGSGRWQFVPTDDSLTDWTVIDMTTGETRLLSDMIDVPGDGAVMPVSAMAQSSDGTEVFRLELGTPETTGWVTTDPDARTFVIAGSLDRVSLLPDYPTLRDNVGDPTLVASEDGGIVAYEVRDSGCLTEQVTRIVTLDVETGEMLACESSVEVSENPMLAGFTSDGQRVALATSNGKVMMVNARGGGTLVVRDGLGRLDNPLFHAPTSTFYIREGDGLLRIPIVPGREMTEVATGLVPGAFGFTTPGGNWIVAQTRDGHIMVDARTGEIVSRMKAPANRAQFADGQFQPGWFGIDRAGDTVIFAIATSSMSPSAPPDAAPAVWLLSPEFPGGLEVTAPEDAGNYWVSPDGETLYAYTSERMSGPGTIWRTPLGAEPDWQPVVEDVTPLPNPMMFFPAG